MNPKVLGAFAGGVLASGAIFYFASSRQGPQAPVPAPVVERIVAKKAVEPGPAVEAPVETPVEKQEPARVKAAAPPPKRDRWSSSAKALAGSAIAAPAMRSQPIAKMQAPESGAPPVFAPAVSASVVAAVPETSKREVSAPEVPKVETARREAVPLTPPSSGSSSSSAAAPTEPRKVTLSGGTLFTVRLAEALSSSKQKTGDSFRATLDQPVIVEGLVIAERGSTIEGRIVESGKTNGVSRLQLELVRFTSSDGQTVGIRTASFEQEGKGGGSSKTDAARKVGIGAAAGAVLGGIIGGGKGAGIGAATGGAAGGGVVLATRGKAVEVPAETRMTFRLTDPVEITEKMNP